MSRPLVVAFAGGKTAGHFHPARNIAEALAALLPRGPGGAPSVSPFFVGAEGGIEADELPRLGYDHLLFPLRGLSRPSGRRVLAAWAGNARAVWLLFKAVARVVAELRRRRAVAVVLTGGYAAAPAGVAGLLLRLPLVLQEQNVHVGKTTRLLARWAAQIHVAHPEAAASLPRRAKRAVRDTGNPIRPLPAPELRDPGAARAALGLPAGRQVVLLVGGSQGAQALNRAAAEALPDAVPAGCVVLWVAGRAHCDEVRAAMAGRRGAGARVRVCAYLEPQAMYQALSVAELAVSRAGAMATSEFLAWGLPAILVPLPTAAADHQSRNAVALERAGAAVVAPERAAPGGGLSGERLWAQVAELLAEPARLARMSQAALRRARPSAAADVARAVAALLPPARGRSPREAPGGGGRGTPECEAPSPGEIA